MRRGLKRIDKGNPSIQQQEQIAIREISAALENEELGSELSDDLLEDGLNRLRQLQVEHCAACGLSIFAHDAVIVDGKSYCKSCRSK